MCSFFFFQEEDGIRDLIVTGVQTCALPIWGGSSAMCEPIMRALARRGADFRLGEIGRASCRERVEISVVAGSLKKKKRQTTHLSPIGTPLNLRLHRWLFSKDI